jgi:hypothetical protein
VKHGHIVFGALLLVAGFIAPAPHPSPTDSEMWHIAPGGNAGVITSRLTESKLVAVFGKQHVSWGEIRDVEGEGLRGTILFASDPHQRLDIVWTDDEHRSLPKQVQVFGDSRSHWETTAGISLATTLKELERINGRPFRLSGFDIDYEGTVKSWNGGTLEKEFRDSGVIVRLRCSKKAGATPEELSKIAGNVEYASDNPVMQKANPHIYQIIWIFR